MALFARSLGVGLVSVATALTLAVPANAGTWTVHEGDDYASVGSDRRWVEVCDMERDGNGVYAYFYYQPYPGRIRVSDGNGADGGCGNATAPGRIYLMEICEDDFGEDTCNYANVG